MRKHINYPRGANVEQLYKMYTYVYISFWKKAHNGLTNGNSHNTFAIEMLRHELNEVEQKSKYNKWRRNLSINKQSKVGLSQEIDNAR